MSRTGLAGIVAVAAALWACSPAPTLPPPSPTSVATPATTEATPPPPASPSPAPSAPPAAAEPKVLCDPFTPPRTTLTCEAAVAAAKAAVGPDPAVASIEFWHGWGPLCLGGPGCALARPNAGHVIFRRTGLPSLVVSVHADKTGKVTASPPRPLTQS